MLKKNSMWPRLRPSWWIVIGVAAIVLVTTLSLLLVVDRFARNYASREAEVRLRQLAGQMRDALDRDMGRRIADIRDLSQRLPLRNFAHPAAMRGVLAQTQSEFNDYAWIGVADTRGKVVAGTKSPLEGRDAARRAWFVGGSKDLYIGEYRPANPLARTLPFAVQPMGLIDIAIPVFDAGGAYKGVLGAHLNWDRARAIANGLISPAERRFQAEILVVRDDGLVLLGPDGLVQTRIATGSLDLSRKGGYGAMVEPWGKDGKDSGGGMRYITGYAHTGQPGLNWTILVRQPEHVALADILVLEKQLVVAAILEGLSLMLCAMLLSYKLVAPLNMLGGPRYARRASAKEDFLPEGWSYYEFNRLSPALGNLASHTFESPASDFEPKVNARIRQLRAAAATWPTQPELAPGTPSPHLSRSRHLFDE